MLQYVQDLVRVVGLLLPYVPLIFSSNDMTRIPQGLSERDYNLIKLYNRWFKAAELVSRMEMEVAFFKSEWPDRESTAKMHLKDAKEQEHEALTELMDFAKSKVKATIE